MSADKLQKQIVIHEKALSILKRQNSSSIWPVKVIGTNFKHNFEWDDRSKWTHVIIKGDVDGSDCDVYYSPTFDFFVACKDNCYEKIENDKAGQMWLSLNENQPDSKPPQLLLDKTFLGELIKKANSTPISKAMSVMLSVMSSVSLVIAPRLAITGVVAIPLYIWVHHIVAYIAAGLIFIVSFKNFDD
jgi:hypothetical protein